MISNYYNYYENNLYSATLHSVITFINKKLALTRLFLSLLFLRSVDAGVEEVGDKKLNLGREESDDVRDVVENVRDEHNGRSPPHVGHDLAGC